ncbi:hypothetical protein ACFVUS_25335 [Nocardia sp. NPDC058058]|uniref:hypothetical protein n=1 Tax=Nocardia sp. NPDC058058 TaxID=3346317 RepID=UPI0036D938C1
MRRVVNALAGVGTFAMVAGCGSGGVPVKASECRFPTTAGGNPRTITFPDAQYVEITRELGGGDGMWYRYGPDIPELANSFKYSWADLDTEFYFLPGVATIASTHPDRIDGKDVTRYDLDINTQAPRALPADADKDTTETVQVWIGAGNLPVRTVIRTNPNTTRESVTTTNYRDWGQSLDIQAPPADKTQPGPH